MERQPIAARGRERREAWPCTMRDQLRIAGYISHANSPHLASQALLTLVQLGIANCAKTGCFTIERAN